MAVVTKAGSTALSVFAPAEMRRAWGQFATGVTLVTVRDGAAARGMTANSFTSVSLEPPLVLVSIDRRNRTHALLAAGDRFAVSVFGEMHRTWSDRFAGRQGPDAQERFEDVPHRLTDDGLPIIADALASFTCRVVAVYPAGDHSLFVGRVEDFAAESYPAGTRPPLLFFGGRYGRLDSTAADQD